MTRATKRILTELAQFNSSPSGAIYVEELAPRSGNDFLQLSAIINGRCLPPETGYTRGRWLLSIEVPATYPMVPPQIRFVTKICHANINWDNGEVCLDVLKERWTPILGVVGALECVGRLLAEGATESPLGIEVASLERTGDMIGKRSLVEFWCDEERWDGGLEMHQI
ncbi:hypothetical protein Golomagni_02960 [Golovinomyces magnicellulatus]|nr:hypothetical protein Golomagni_02960 [Golovinomyces magnicellulatus]